jgi:hypothetical protein
VSICKALHGFQRNTYSQDRHANKGSMHYCCRQTCVLPCGQLSSDSCIVCSLARIIMLFALVSANELNRAQPHRM